MAYQSGYQLVTIGSDGEPTFDSNGDPVPSGSIIPFPVIGNWGRTIKTRRDAVRLKTELGRNWVFPQADIRTREVKFYCLPEDLIDFQTMDDAVSGDRDPFLYYEDTDLSPTGAFFCRKSPDWDEGTEEPVTPNGTVERRVTFTLYLEEEPTGTSVTT